MNAPVIALTDFGHRYASKVVVDLDRVIIPPGTTALLGPNGAGKTTMLKAIATVAAVQTGTVMIDGLDVSDPADRLAIRRRLGYAGQNDPLPSKMRVGEFCNYVAALKEIGPARRRRRWTAWALGEVGLNDQVRARISTLSGGMRRRLSLAQALLGNPSLLILDEPLVSLDAAHRSAVVRGIAASADSRTTVVATHHADELAAVCQHIMVMLGGRLAFGGPPRELAARAEGRVWETSRPVDDPLVRALGPDRFRVVGRQPADARACEPTVHDGYLAILADHGIARAV